MVFLRRLAEDVAGGLHQPPTGDSFELSRSSAPGAMPGPTGPELRWLKAHGLRILTPDANAKPDRHRSACVAYLRTATKFAATCHSTERRSMWYNSSVKPEIQ